MERSADYQKLLDDYSELAKRPDRMLNLDESASLVYYETELAYLAGTLDPRDKSLAAKWTRNLHALEDYTEANAFPRDNRRKSASFTSEQRRLITFVNTQLRATSLGKRNTFQRRRLELIRGYIRTSRVDTWAAQLELYRAFVLQSRGVQPSRRSKDSVERSIRNWQDRQRAAYRQGTLSDAQIEALEHTVFWRWDPRHEDARSGTSIRNRGNPS